MWPLVTASLVLGQYLGSINCGKKIAPDGVPMLESSVLLGIIRQTLMEQTYCSSKQLVLRAATGSAFSRQWSLVKKCEFFTFIL
jgi:hypothetical protein